MAVSHEILDFLGRTDTCTISNAIEVLNVRMRNEGFLRGGVRCMFPELPPVAGFAVTGRMRAGAPPISGLCYYDRQDFWQYVASIPGPKIVVMEDMDSPSGMGALAGEIHAQIGRALGCVGWLTNGRVRDLNAVRKAGFQCFAEGPCVSHAYAHIVDFGGPVEIDGLEIHSGDLLHGDLNGVQTVPIAIAPKLPEVVRHIEEREAELIRLCQAPDFSLQKLEPVLCKSAVWPQEVEIS
jgi:regulator of RNase E activity RraA